MENRSVDEGAEVNCPHCGQEMPPVDEYGTRSCDCVSLENSIGKILQEK